MDRRRRWKLLEYQHQEQSAAYGLYHWAPDTELRQALRDVMRLDEELKHAPTEWAQILRVMDWVHHLSPHQGWDEAPDLSALALVEAAQTGRVVFRCVEFAHLLQQALAVFAFPARVIGLRRPGADDGLGKGHVVVDVWSGDHGKWVVLDPQLNRFYTSRDGAVLSAWEIHERVRAHRFEDIQMSREDEIRRDYDGIDAQDNQDYATLVVPEGFDRDEVWQSLPDHGDVEGFLRFWKGYYHQLEFRRSYSLTRPKPQAASDPTTELFYCDVHDLPPVVFQRMPQAVTFTTDRTKIVVPVNGVEMQWAPALVPEDAPLAATRRIRLELTHSMPWFDHYEVTVNGTLAECSSDAKRDVALQAGENVITVRPVNDCGRPGHQARLRLWVN